MVTTFLTFVALNTLVFLGLSLGKAIPWPHPLTPQALRAPDGDDTCSRRMTAPQRALLWTVLALHSVPREEHPQDE